MVAVLFGFILKELQLPSRSVQGDVLLDIGTIKSVQHTRSQLRISGCVTHADDIALLDRLYLKIREQPPGSLRNSRFRTAAAQDVFGKRLLLIQPASNHNLA